MNTWVRIEDGTTGTTPALTHVPSRNAGADTTSPFAAATSTSSGSKPTSARSQSGEEPRFRAVSARVAPSPTRTRSSPTRSSAQAELKPVNRRAVAGTQARLGSGDYGAMGEYGLTGRAVREESHETSGTALPGGHPRRQHRRRTMKTRLALAGAMVALCALAHGGPAFGHGDHDDGQGSGHDERVPVGDTYDATNRTRSGYDDLPPPNPYGSWGTPTLMVHSGTLVFDFPTARGAQDLGPALNGCAPPRGVAAPRTYVWWRMSNARQYSVRNTRRCGEGTTHRSAYNNGFDHENFHQIDRDAYWFRAPAAWNPWHSPSFSIMSVDGETWSSGNNRGFTINATTGQIRTVSGRRYIGRYQIRIRVRAKRTTWTGTESGADKNLPSASDTDTARSLVGQSSSTHVGYFSVVTNTNTARRPDAPRNLRASSGTSGVTLTWDAPGNSDNVESYRIEKADFLASLPARFHRQAWQTLRGVVAKTTTTWTDSPPQGYLRHYRVRAVNGRGWSQPSNVVSGRRLYGPRPTRLNDGSIGNPGVNGLKLGVVIRPKARAAPARELFKVTSNGVNVQVTRVTLVEADANEDEIVIDTDPLSISDGDRIEVRYTDPYPFYDDKKQTGSDVVGGGRQVLETEAGEDSTSWCLTINREEEESTHTCESRPATSLAVSDDDDESDGSDETLTVQWNPDPPATHNGTAFTVGLEFSKAVSASADQIKGAITATGATVTAAALADGSDRLWNLTITPSGRGEVTLLLGATTDCSAAGAICTSGGEMLSSGIGTSALFYHWLSVEDAEATEGDDATLDFTVTLAPAASEPVTVDYATSDGTATEPADYTSTTGTLTFTAGQTSQTVSVPIVDDDTPDSGETFILTLSASSVAYIIDATGTGTILNDEASNDETPAGPLTGFTLVDASTNTDVGTIADGGTFTLSDPANGSYGVRVETAANAEFGSVKLALSGAKAVTQTESYAPWSLYGDDGTNVAGADLPVGSYTLTATAHAEAGGQGAQLQTLTVSFTVAAEVAASPLAGFTLVDASTNTDVGTITDGGTFTLSDPANGSYGVRVETAANAEFGSVKLALSGAKGGDADRELRPLVAVRRRRHERGGRGLPVGSYRLSATAHEERGGQGTQLQTLAVAFTVVEQRPGISVEDAQATEGTDTTMDFVVRLSRAATEQVTVDYATSNGTATAESDYTATSGQLTFSPGDTSKTVSVPILTDSVNDDGRP